MARQVLRQTCNWSNDVAVIVFFGFLHPVKGIENLLMAFKQVLSVHPHARLLLVGGVESLALPAEQATKYWNKLHELVADLNLDKIVHISGYLPADTAWRYIAGPDFGVLRFNCGVTIKSGSLLTMLAYGLPVVATHHDPDLADEQIVRLVTPRDLDGLATPIIDLLADRAMRSQLSDAGRQFVRNKTWDAIALAHLKIYQTLLKPLIS